MVLELKLFTNAVTRTLKEKDEIINDLKVKLKSNFVLEKLCSHYKDKCIALEAECSKLKTLHDKNVKVIKEEIYDQLFNTNDDFELIE